MAHQVGASLGSYLPGILHDITGSYTPTLFGASAALLAAMIGCLTALPGTAGGSGPGSPDTGTDRRTQPNKDLTDAHTAPMSARHPFALRRPFALWPLRAILRSGDSEGEICRCSMFPRYR